MNFLNRRTVTKSDRRRASRVRWVFKRARPVGVQKPRWVTKNPDH